MLNVDDNFYTCLLVHIASLYSRIIYDFMISFAFGS